MRAISAFPVFNHGPIHFQIYEFLEFAIDFLESLVFECCTLILIWIHFHEWARFENWVKNGGIKVLRMQILLQIDNFDGLIWRQNV